MKLTSVRDYARNMLGRVSARAVTVRDGPAVVASNAALSVQHSAPGALGSLRSRA